MKLLSSVAASSVGSTWRSKCPAQTVKVFFDQMTAFVLQQFDGSFSEAHFETKRDHRFLAEASLKLLSFVAASSVGSTWRRECPA
jgi:hypothetical protein